MVAAGPLQLIVILLDAPAVGTAVADRFAGWRSQQFVQLVDSAIVSKDPTAAITVAPVPELPASNRGPIETLLGPVLEGSGNDRSSPSTPSESRFVAQPAGDFGMTRDQILEIADLIPRSSQALLLLVEHQWALSLKEALGVGGSVLASGFVTPATIEESAIPQV